MTDADGDLEGLPHYDANAALQAKSIKALNAVLKGDNTLILRDERQTDYGVDASFEVVLQKRATNFRSQVQIKAVTNVRIGLNGLVSLSVPVHNVNYLLNGSCPIYVLYLADADEFYFLWLRDERRRLDKHNRKWSSQNTITLQFSKRFLPAAIPGIAHRIVQEEFLRKQIMHRLMMRTFVGETKLSLNPDTLKAIDGGTAYEVIKHHGFTLISNGNAPRVMDLVDLLNTAQKQEARIELVRAYAWFMQGRFQKAAACLGEASTKKAGLSDDEQGMLRQMRDVCDVQVGRISRAEYTERLAKESKQLKGDEAVINSLERARFQYLGVKELHDRAAALQVLRDVVKGITQRSSIGAPIKLQARTYLAFAEGVELSLKVTHAYGMLAIRRDLKQDWAPPDDSELAQALSKLRDWDNEITQLIAEAFNLGIPYLQAEAVRTRLVIRTHKLNTERFKSKFMRLGSGPSRESITEAKDDAVKAIDGFIAAFHQEGELRTRLELAEVHEVADELEEAKSIANEVRPIAEAIGLAEIARQATAFLTGTTILQEFEREASLNVGVDNDVGWSDMDAAKVARFARSAIEASRLPLERLPVMIREVESIKAAATERLHWCRHLVLIQNLLHSRHPITAYAADPLRFGLCEKHRYESIKGSSDFTAVLNDFKRAYCMDCPDRDPKLTASK